MKRVMLCAALIAWSGMASAVVYKWIDPQGNVQYGDRPPAGVHAEVMEMLGARAAHGPQAADNAAAPTTRSMVAAALAQATDASERKAVQDEVAGVREKQCTEAQERYKRLIEGRRLFRTNENGEREYLTSDEIDAERIQAKLDVDSICGSTSS